MLCDLLDSPCAWRLTYADLFGGPSSPQTKTDDKEREGPEETDGREAQMIKPVELGRCREVSPGSPCPANKFDGAHRAAAGKRLGCCQDAVVIGYLKEEENAPSARTEKKRRQGARTE